MVKRKNIQTIVPKLLGPNQVCVMASWGKFSPRIRKGWVVRWPWQDSNIIETVQKSVIVGFYGIAGRFTNVYLSWLLKAFPTRQEFKIWQEENVTIFLRDSIENALRVIERILRTKFKAAVDAKTLNFQNLSESEISQFGIYDSLQKEKIFMDIGTEELKIEKEYVGFFKDALFQFTDMAVTNQIPAKVWDRVLTEVNDEVKKWEEDEGQRIKDRFEEDVNKKVKEFEEREDRNATLRYDEAYQKERTEELERFKQDLKQHRDVEMTSRQAEKTRRKLLLIALKEINTAITFNKIRFVEAIEANQILSTPIGSKVKYFGQGGELKEKTMYARKYPIFSRKFGPLFSAEKIQLDVTASIFYRVHDALRLVTNVGSETRATIILVSKLASSLRATISRLTMSEIFEERQKLVEMLRRELDDVAENWGIDIASVAIEEIFLEDPGFQKQLDDRREMELYGEKRIEERKIEANQIGIRGRQKAERVALEAEAEREREINRVKQEIERAKVQFETKKIEVETFLQRKQYEAQKILIEAQGDVAELSAAKKVLTDNVIKMQLIQEMPNLIEKMVSTLSQAILSPEQYVALITGMPIFQALKNLTEKSILSDKLE